MHFTACAWPPVWAVFVPFPAFGFIGPLPRAPLLFAPALPLVSLIVILHPSLATSSVASVIPQRHAHTVGEDLRVMEDTVHAKRAASNPLRHICEQVDAALANILAHAAFGELARTWQTSQTRYVPHWDTCPKTEHDLSSQFIQH